MEKRLNSVKTRQAMEQAGLSQTAIAQELGVSKEAVSQWLNDKSFPRPNKLLQLGKLLSLRFDDLVIKEDRFVPKVAFRKMKGTITKNKHVERAQEMGVYLRSLVPFLPFSTLEMPPVLKSPVCDYDYLCKVVSRVRNDINVGATDNMDFTHLIKRFRDLQAVIVPVLWGSKQRHENAVHIHLPDSQTTWVYLNLDTHVHDFKFWMAHELGHCLSPNLAGDAAEDFADAFAASLLFPHESAEQAYASINRQSTPVRMISHVLDLAREKTISPYTVIKQVNRYAGSKGTPAINLGTGFDGAVTNFNKSYARFSEALFGHLDKGKTGKPSARDYIEITESAFETPVFEMLKTYLILNNKGAGFVQTVLDVPLLDARSIHAQLT